MERFPQTFLLDVLISYARGPRWHLRPWGHLSFLYYMVKTGPMLRMLWLKNNFFDLPRHIECKFK